MHGLYINFFHTHTIITHAVVSQRCTPVDYPPFIDRHEELNSPLQVPHPIQFLITSYLFGCEGNVTDWQLYTVNNGSHPIEFQVWRANTTISATLTLNLVGANYFPDATPDSNNFLSLPVAQDQQIRVKPGDILGIRTIESVDSSNDFRIQDYILMGTIVTYSFGGATEPTPSSLPFQNVNARFSLIHFLPVMNVIVVPGNAKLYLMASHMHY